MWIMDGRVKFGVDLEGYYHQVMKRRGAGVGVEVPPPTVISTTPALQARINHNRWICDCPDCNSAEYVWPNTPLMMCERCWNGVAGYKWRRVKVPKEYVQIEGLLRHRPIPQERNWEPNETVEKLRQQNKEKGHSTEI